MFKYIFLLVCMMVSCGTHATTAPLPEHKIAVLGLGGRSQYLLLECMKKNKNIRVVAVCDDHAAESLNWFVYSLQRRASPMFVDSYRRVFERTTPYPDTDEGLRKLFNDNPQLDSVFITSANDRHFKHLSSVLAHSTCKNIYMEKPLFITLDEFQRFKRVPNDTTIAVGLTLRYATLTQIIVDILQAHATELGTLKKVKSWERLDFGHALTIIMMNWRRYISRSGGLLLEKSIHDLDLALFFMRSLNMDPQDIVINTEVAHRLFKKSQKKNVLKNIASDDRLRDLIGGWCGVAFQRTVKFAADPKGYLDIAGTIENVFKDLPDNDNFAKSDIIPDYHRLMATCTTAAGTTVALELEVDMSGFRLKAERGIQFEFERGTVAVDMSNNEVTVTLKDGTTVRRDLQMGTNIHHGDGDAYIAQLILGVLPENRYKATLHDEVVQLAMFMGLTSEQQAVGKRKQGTRIRKINNAWSYA